MKKVIAGIIGAVLINISASFAQCGINNDGSLITGAECDLRAISTAVPFLLIAPDSRSGAMGDAGVALSPDANAQHWNASKLAFSEKEMEISLGYSPWLRQLVDDMSLAYLAFYKKLDKRSAVGASLRYFTLGDINFTDNDGRELRTFRPNEFALDVSYSLQLSDNFSGGLTARWVNSNLTGGTTNIAAGESKAANAFAVDVSTFYRNDDINIGDKDAILAFGLVVSNIGNKVSYTNTDRSDFIPTNLRLGTALTIEFDSYNRMTFAYDANKLLVPSRPLYATGTDTIIAGRDNDVGVAAGIFGSFTDAPGFQVIDETGEPVYNADGTVQIEKGSVLKEELREINHSFGFEYWYADQFAVRAGYFYEHPTKGNRQYFTIGAGLRYNLFGLDLSYLIATKQRNPLANTLRFTISLKFDQSSE